VLYPELENLVYIGTKRGKCLVWQRIDYIHRDIVEAIVLQSADAIYGLTAIVATVEAAELLVVERLYADAYTIDRKTLKVGNETGIDVVGITFEGYLGFVGDSEIFTDSRKYLAEFVCREQRGRTSTEIYGVERCFTQIVVS